jgi:ABC-type molybdate transport system substrate-binding protein
MRRVLAALVAILAAASVSAAEPVRLHGAGSLRHALGEVGAAFEAAGGEKVEAAWGASGLLYDRLAAGEKGGVFASANMAHPQKLAAEGKAGPVVLFARNRLCLLARPGLDPTPATALDLMLDPRLKLGTSTPRADPSGDYAWALFAKAEAVRAGSRAALEQKALKLTGGPDSPKGPPGRSIYGHLIATGEADVFLTYCTNARVAVAEVAGARFGDLPPSLEVGADYGLTVLAGAPESAYRLALFILSAPGQEILARHGFAAPTLPTAPR